MIKFILLLSLGCCAFSAGFKIQPKIVNGVPSDPNTFKFFVQIRAFKDNTEVSCGGALLNDRYTYNPNNSDDVSSNKKNP